MAYLVLHNGTAQNIPREKAESLWRVLTGEIEGTAEQQEFALKVKKLYLNWRKAPKSYVEQHRAVLYSMGVFRND